MRSKEIIEKILESADVKINGNRPWDIKILDERIYNRVISQGTLGLGEAYMDGWWECQQLDEMVNRVVRLSDIKALYKNLASVLHIVKSRLLNLQTKSGSKKVALEHYDLGNDLYRAFLDPYIQYSCGYWKDTLDLNVAQEQKLDLICKKLDLKATDTLLDIGCGWGGLAKYAAEKYGCHVTGITISKEQAEFARKFTDKLSVEIKTEDYRDISGKYDKVVSVGMFEHVGGKNYRKIMRVVKDHLSEDGLFLLHTIGRSRTSAGSEPWLTKYIFPNSVLPSESQISSAFHGLFVMEDWHNFGQYYDKTTVAWWKNFDKAWPNFQKKYGQRFYRMFRYYLLSCAGLFRARDTQLWQIVLSPKGVLGGYKSVR